MSRIAPAFILLTITGILILGPLVVRIDPMTTDADHQLQPPDSHHLLGTDLLGRDVLSRAIHGGGMTLSVAFAAALFAACAGLPLGWFAGLKLPVMSHALMILINAFLAIPGLVISLVVLTLLGRGSWPMIVALAVSQVAPFAFVVRSAVRSIQSAGFVEAGISMGATRLRIFRDHILPNIAPAVLAYSGVVFSYVLINGAALSFLGVGNEPGVPDWGVMLAEGRAAFRSAPWISLAPGIAITLTVWAVNRIADDVGARNQGASVV